ncbi:hypothetical protein V8G54_017305 [Vigna mungo]|uniref:Uncharacterized protein n=1 Tax=Vigna mungo TaxID=3915 RepID=A0AAQ3NPL2_VIGMU
MLSSVSRFPNIVLSASLGILEAPPLPQKELISFFNNNNRNLKRFSSEFVNTVCSKQKWQVRIAFPVSPYSYTAKLTVIGKKKIMYKIITKGIYMLKSVTACNFFITGTNQYSYTL